MNKHWIKVFIVTVSFCLQAAHSESLTFVKSTRLIFNADQRAIPFPLKNDTDSHYLVKGAVLNLNGHQPGDVNRHFLVLPEVQFLEPGNHRELRVVRVGGTYPQDRESVFFVNGVFIPKSANQSVSALNLAISINVKMFYRPEAIVDKNAIKRIAKRLQFELTPRQLRVQNPTPYYATFSALSVDSSSLTNEQLKVMVPPFGESRYAVHGVDVETAKVSWSLIDELGNDTERMVREVGVQK